MGPVRIGCAGWGYDEWRGGFYPPGAPAGEHLARYARVFPAVEIDSAYYQAPRADQVARWTRETPEGFLFCPKMPGAFTHDARLRVTSEAVRAYVDLYAPMREAGKLGPFLVEIPASFPRPGSEDALEAFLAAIPRGVDVAVEMRHASWWTRETYRALEARGAALVWSYVGHAWGPTARTADWLYVRLVGDRTLTRFDRVQRDATPVMRRLKDLLASTTPPPRSTLIFVNNHLAGFAPRTASHLAEVLGLPPLDTRLAARDAAQRGLGDF